MSRIPALVLLVTLLYGCGGGGGGSSDSALVNTPDDSTPEPEPTEIQILDSTPVNDAPAIDAGTRNANFAHLAQSDLAISIEADCANNSTNTLRRNLFDMAAADFDQVVDHQIACELEENSSYAVTANGTRDNGAEFLSTLTFSTGTTASSETTVQDSATIQLNAIDDIFQDYVEGALIGELDVPGLIEDLLVDLVIELAEANWDTLTDPDAIYPVVAERVIYNSRAPDGSPVEVSGLVSRPIAVSEFPRRDRFIILTHATGSTPGNLNPADAWFILANMFASRGYLVIAPDNYGRGNTSEQEETYLMANQTAYTTLDFARRVMADEIYSDIYSGNEAALIGYSQGGHSAIATWLMNELQGEPDFDINLVYAGGAPHNLYQTMRGVLRFIDGSCDDDYCEFVDEETTIPFATDRILPALFAYTDTGLSLDEVVNGDTIDEAFVSGFLANEAEYDTFKALLQLNSFTSINNPDLLSSSNATVHLYHSVYDRLVPAANTAELAAVLEGTVTVDNHENRCNSSGYEVIFNLTEKVGVLHTLCGLAVLDDAMQDLQ